MVIVERDFVFVGIQRKHLDSEDACIVVEIEVPSIIGCLKFKVFSKKLLYFLIIDCKRNNLILQFVPSIQQRNLCVLDGCFYFFLSRFSWSQFVISQNKKQLVLKELVDDVATCFI
eukprot:TRINITY_DN45980_c2_g1_i1.p2 TRINITY_DN45980_c2_g1~~TRINITY_DN45980_c2_g1_i1.p2  ORF type:complete len:116 (+),score=5.06 TRINITY_DN45980_c2_g1_i1:76-423(+)